MLFKKKTRTWLITLLLLFSLLSLNLNDNLQAEEPSDSEYIEDLINIIRSLIDFNDKLNPHPFRYVGVWESYKTQNIEGDMEFELYFSAPIITQIQLLELINYQDTLKIDVYHIDSDGVKTLIDNGNKTIILEPEIQDYIQKYFVKLENIQVAINRNEYLAFVIEIEQSDKPLTSFVEKRFDTRVIPSLERFAGILKEFDDPTLQEIASYIDIALENLTNLDIGGEEFAALVNVLFSSAFYYGSVDYPSSVKFYNDVSEEIVLYFHNEYSDLQYELYYTLELFPFEKIANEIIPTTSTAYAWPPILTAINELESPENISLESEIVNWFLIWALFTFGESSEEVDTNKVTYYLVENGKLTTDKTGETNLIREDLSEEPSIWTASGFERNKLLTNITAYLYIHYSKIFTIGKVKINATLKKNSKIIATDEEDLDRTNIFELIQQGPNVPTKFTFDNFDISEEIWYTDNLSLEISYINKPILGALRPVRINYGSELYPSKIIFTLKETDNIEIGGLNDKAVYSGGSAHYILNVTSENSKNYKDTVKISAEVKEKIGNWNITVYPNEVEINSGTVEKVHIFVNSTALDDSVYDIDEIQFFVNATGKTGFASNTSYVYVSRDAVEYGFDVIGLPDKIEVKHGTTKTFSIVLRNNNKGYISDKYGIETETKNNFNVIVNISSEGEILVYNEYSDENEEITANITVEVPWYTYVESDELIVNIFSSQSNRYPPLFEKSFKVTVKVITPNILESAYKFFESAAAKMGLTDKYAGWKLISVVVVLLIIFIIVIIYLKKRRFVDIICLERIKEINPDENAKYEITVKNPYKYELNYNIQSKIENDTQGFDISVDKTELTLQSGEERIINLVVKPNDNVKKEDWCEVKIVIKPINKTKTNEISTITTIKNGSIDIRLSGIIHWPKIFKKDDRVETSFKVWNHGNVSTGKIRILFLVNGNEKNKIEDVIIPRGGYADIEIPWIADPGKNEVYIIVN
jgi:hypothetical protein